MAEALAPLLSRIDALKRQLYDAITNPGDYASMVAGRTQEAARAAQALQAQAFANPQNPLQITDPQALNQLTNMIMSGPLGFAPAGITAYHGSPYLFSQFDRARVGTGEGAQAYGVGAGYTSEGRPVAESYRASIAAQKQRAGEDMGNVTIKGKPVNWDKPEEVAAFELARHAGDRQAAADFHARTFMGGEDNPAVKLLRSNKELPKVDLPGYLYKGDIPDEILPKFLDWDKPFKEQTPEVKQAIDKYWKDNNIYGDPTKLSGAGIYDSVVAHLFGDAGRAGAQKAASEALDSIGIRGIRYLDQGSRGEGKGTSNFVPFRPEDYKIQEINDIPIEDWISKGLLGP